MCADDDHGEELLLQGWGRLAEPSLSFLTSVQPFPARKMPAGNAL